MKKGQNFRLFISGLCVAASKSCSFEETAELEEISTKDSSGRSKDSTMKSKSWNGSADALVLTTSESGAYSLNQFLSAILAGQPVGVKFTETEGDKNRSEVSSPGLARSGQALINDLTIKASVNEEVTVSVKLLGYGALTKSVEE